jgi:virulence-associated protein VapD
MNKLDARQAKLINIFKNTRLKLLKDLQWFKKCCVETRTVYIEVFLNVSAPAGT